MVSVPYGKQKGHWIDYSKMDLTDEELRTEPSRKAEPVRKPATLNLDPTKITVAKALREATNVLMGF